MLTTQERETVSLAMEILGRYLKTGPVFDSPSKVREFCCARLGAEEREVFCVLYLDSQHRLIEAVDESTGTLAQTSVYPREIVKRALALNAGAVILSHNHPSGLPEPSRADETLTDALSKDLKIVDVRVLDHIVVGANHSVSFAERGLI